MIGFRSTFTLMLASALLAAALASGAPALAQSSDAEFAKHPVKSTFKRKPAPVNLKSHKDASTFRTRLREAAAKGPNFAGHMTVALWGCGTSCQTVALIDARNGRVYFGPTAAAGARYRLDSRLLIVNPPEALKEQFGNDTPPEGYATEYHLWENNKLRRIRK